ncbi:MAG TPA: hypothetical protein VI112_05345 [Bacteroidia bacterium]|jgi:hypothetical protein
MKTLFFLLPCLLFFAFAEGQTATIKVRKADCNCGVTDTLAAKDTLENYSSPGSNIRVPGKVIDSITGKPLANVVLYYTFGKSKIRTGTTKEGVFFITGPPGFYTIYAAKDCYRFAGSEMGPEQPGLIVCDIKMVPCGKRLPSTEKTPVKGKN